MSAEEGVSGQQWSVDADYVKTLGLKIVKGRDFSAVALDSQSVIINETLARSLNLRGAHRGENYKLLGYLDNSRCSRRLSF